MSCDVSVSSLNGLMHKISPVQKERARERKIENKKEPVSSRGKKIEFTTTRYNCFDIFSREKKKRARERDQN